MKRADSRGEKLDFSLLVAQNILTVEQCCEIIKAVLITKSGKLTSSGKFKFFIYKHNLIDLYESVLYHTDKYDTNVSFNERLYRLYKYNVDNAGKCLKCFNPTTFINFKCGFNKYCHQRCSASHNPSCNYLTEKGRKIKSEKLSIARKNMKLSDEWKNNLRKAAQKEEVKNKKKQTNLTKYGCENPGVLGAYSSKAAREYITTFLKNNSIDSECCYFKCKNKQEFFQMVFVPFLNKKIYMSYDLIVFKTISDCKNKDLNKIVLVLEYNGPWHYSDNELIGKEDEPSVPYTTCKYTKKERNILDKIKLEHIKTFNPEKILIYWEKSKQLEEYSD